MQASAVSGTANPRRRSSPVSNVRQSIEILKDPTISLDIGKSNNNGAGDGDGNVGSGSKEPSQSISSGAPLERSKTKKPSQLPNSNAPLRIRTRTRKTPPKSRWQTVASVLTKNLLLLLVLVGLLQTGRKLMVYFENNSVSVLGFIDLEGRIARVESTLKTMAKMFDVQMEVLDKKSRTEVGNLRIEVNRKLDDVIKEIDKGLKKLKEKSEILDELRPKEVLTKDEVLRLYDELKKGDGGFGLGFDEVRGMAREIVKEEIEKHAGDGVGRVDFALGAGGGAVVEHSEPFVSGKFGRWWAGKVMNRVHNDAVKMLTPSFGEPGQCFGLRGSSGYVVIRLRTAIVPEAVTLEHVAKSVAYDLSSAPKHCRVFGLLVGERGSETKSSDSPKEFVLTDFIYDLEKSHAQTFDVFEEARSSVIDTVLLEFSSNYGSSTHTCIYRFRVHGHEPKSVSLVLADS